MLFQFTISSITLLLPGAHARIVGFKMAKTVLPGATFSAVAVAQSIAATSPPADIDIDASYLYAPASSASAASSMTPGIYIAGRVFPRDGTFISKTHAYIYMSSTY